MSSPKVKTFKNFEIPEKEGRYHRLVCMTGEKKKVSYFIMGNRIILGRSEKSDIQIMDSKSSRRHAELVIVSDKCILSDLNSRNGVIVNDIKIKQHCLVDGDKIAIGPVIFKYNVVEVKNEFLPELSNLDLEESNTQEYEEENNSENQTPEASRKKLVYFAVIFLVVGFLILEDGPKKGKNIKKPRKGNKIVDLSYNERKVASTKSDKEIDKRIKSILHRGRRELREKNFFRAIEQFNLALIADPSNSEAGFLLKKSQQRLDDFIQAIARKAGNETDQKRYGSSILQWCEIVRYLRNYPDDERYLAAEKQVNFLANKLGYEENEYKCF